MSDFKSDLIEYLLDNHGYCDRDGPKRNNCYWGPGCLKTGWLGRRCKHWHPIDDVQLDAMIRAYGSASGNS